MQDLIEVREKEALFCIAPGPLYMIAVNGKEKVWRAAIVRFARQLPASTKANLRALSSRIGSDAGDHARDVRTVVAKAVYRILVDACQAMTKRSAKEQAYFVRHVNRSVTHHAGWLPVMQRMGILAKTTKRYKSRLVFGDPSTAYKIRPFSSRLVGFLSKWSRQQAVLLATHIPRTLDDWGEACEYYKKMAGAPADRESYSFLWGFRAAMVAERAAAGFEKLRYSKKNTTEDIAKVFPDQSEWASYFCPDGHTPVGEFVRRLGYEDSIEYLTCDLCIFMPLAEQLSTEAGEHEPKVKRCRIAMDAVMSSRHGQQAHPAVVAQQAAASRT